MGGDDEVNNYYGGDGDDFGGGGDDFGGGDD
jgi:hypothetical protein